jgi:hypothetical protein
MQTGSDRYVVFHGGLALPLEPVLLLLDFEARGLTVTRDGDHILVRPAGRLSQAERDAVGRWKAHVLALVDYVDDGEVH